MAGLAEDGGEGGKGEVGFAGEPIIFRPLEASEASRWSMISSFEARSPFVYSIRIQPHPLRYADDKKLPESQGVIRNLYCTGQGEGDARVREKGQTGCFRLRPGPLLAAVSLTTAWQRNLFHSKRCLNGTANSATTCLWQAASARQRRTQQGPHARSSSQSVLRQKSIEGESSGLDGFPLVIK
jgi:hypothetical protein